MASAFELYEAAQVQEHPGSSMAHKGVEDSYDYSAREARALPLNLSSNAPDLAPPLDLHPPASEIAPKPAERPLSPGFYEADGKTLAAERLGPGDQHFISKSDKLQRDFEIHLPPGYTDSKPVPMFYVLPGVDETIESVKQDSHLNALADEKGFGVVYFEALPKIAGKNSWNTYHGALSSKSDAYNDLHYIDHSRDQILRMISVQTDKQYLIGHSEGGDVAQYVARQMKGVFAGIGTIKSTRQIGDPLPNLDDPMAAVFLRSDSDPVLPPSGGTQILPLELFADKLYQSSPALQAMLYAKVDECTSSKTRHFKADDVTDYTCKLAPVKEYVLHGAGHHWNDDPNFTNSRKVVDFLLKYQKPEKLIIPE